MEKDIIHLINQLMEKMDNMENRLDGMIEKINNMTSEIENISSEKLNNDARASMSERYKTYDGPR